MQKLTRAEISWIVSELTKAAKNMKINARSDELSELEAQILVMRSEQYTDISKRLQTAIDSGDKRIEIK